MALTVNPVKRVDTERPAICVPIVKTTETVWMESAEAVNVLVIPAGPAPSATVATWASLAKAAMPVKPAAQYAVTTAPAPNARIVFICTIAIVSKNAQMEPIR